MNVVFLDFDGVLNSWRFFHDALQAGTCFNPKQQVDRKAVRWLNEIVEKSSAKVVISYTLPPGGSFEELSEILVKAGFRGEIIDRTPVVGINGRRGLEIQEWIHDNGVSPDKIVILDDGDDMLPLMDRLVLVDARKGLKPKHVEKALALLAKGSG